MLLLLGLLVPSLTYLSGFDSGARGSTTNSDLQTLRDSMREGFGLFNEKILENMCPTTLRAQRVTETTAYPYEANITRCELDRLQNGHLPAFQGFQEDVAISTRLGRKDHVLTSHPSARGISNQFMFNGGFFQWATEQGVMVVPPVFHMDGYNITNDYTLPFSFLFDRESFDRMAQARYLSVLSPSAATAAFERTKSTIIYGLGRKCMNFEASCTGIYNSSSTSSSRIVKAIHWKVPNWNWIQIPFSKHVNSVVGPVIQFLTGNRCFASLHFRVELDSSNREQWAGPAANFGSLKEHIANTARILERYRDQEACYLYVASYLPQEHHAFEELRRSVPHWKIYTKFDFFPKTLESFRTMTRNMMAVMEMSILEKANVFLGNCRSSFSTAIAKRRSKSSSPVEWVIPCTSAS